jgi:hypothetical protein
MVVFVRPQEFHLYLRSSPGRNIIAFSPTRSPWSFLNNIPLLAILQVVSHLPARSAEALRQRKSVDEIVNS